jgi:hypothetical protein
MAPETIRARALECLQLSQNAKRPQHRALLLDIAYCCADLANALDRFQAFAEVDEDIMCGDPSTRVICLFRRLPRRRRLRAV